MPGSPSPATRPSSKFYETISDGALAWDLQRIPAVKPASFNIDEVIEKVTVSAAMTPLVQFVGGVDSRKPHFLKPSHLEFRISVDSRTSR
jgi:hypothetical protein